VKAAVIVSAGEDIEMNSEVGGLKLRGTFSVVRLPAVR